jgi:hypothetical protein
MLFNFAQQLEVPEVHICHHATFIKVKPYFINYVSEPMGLGMETVMLLIEQCDNLVALGR